MGCLKVVVRNLVGLLAFTKWLIGIFMLSFCLWTIATSSKFDQLVDGKLPITYFCLAAGLLLLIDGTIGWAGVSKRSRILMKLFLILTFFIFITEIGIILTLSIFKTNSTQVAEQLWQEMNPKSQYLVQEHLLCCGLNGPTFIENSRDIDQSCYHREPTASSTIENPSNMVFSGGSSSSEVLVPSKSIINADGCRQKIIDFSHDNRLYILLASASLLAYQMITMLLTVSAISLTRRRRQGHMDSLEELDQSSSSGIHQHHQHSLHGHGPTYM